MILLLTLYMTFFLEIKNPSVLYGLVGELPTSSIGSKILKFVILQISVLTLFVPEQAAEAAREGAQGDGEEVPQAAEEERESSPQVAQ